MTVPLLLDASWLERFYRAAAWQSVDQIRRNIKCFLLVSNAEIVVKVM
jgi:hypothetical protein